MSVLTLPNAEALALSVRAKALVFDDPRSRALLQRIRRIAPSDATALIVGETGTGKEIVARHLHELSPRRARPFVAVNCGALSETLVESELFGHERGAFTGAVAAKQGWFETAQGGTLFLDEIGDLPAVTQVKLLRVLQEREVVRVGARAPIPIDVRLIAATNVDLQEAVRAGKFREDLYYRLNVVSIAIPSLAERRDDIPLLANHFVGELGRRYAKATRAFAPEAMALLVAAPWKGNVRQLQNAVEKCVALCPTPIVPAALVSRALEGPSDDLESFDEARASFERDYLSQLLRITDGNVSQAARLAKRNRSDFYSLLNRHELDPAVFKK